MGPTSYMRSVVDRNVVMRRIPLVPLALNLGSKWRVVSMTLRPVCRPHPTWRNLSTHWIGGLLGIGIFLDDLEKRKVPLPATIRNPCHPSSLLGLCSDCAMPALIELSTCEICGTKIIATEINSSLTPTSPAT